MDWTKEVAAGDATRSDGRSWCSSGAVRRLLLGDCESEFERHLDRSGLTQRKVRSSLGLSDTCPSHGTPSGQIDTWRSGHKKWRPCIPINIKSIERW